VIQSWSAPPCPAICLWCAALSVVALPCTGPSPATRPLPKVGACRLGLAPQTVCMASKGGHSRGSIEKSGQKRPLGFYSSGAYCVSRPCNQREAIQMQGSSCPLGWFSSGNYCVKSRRSSAARCNSLEIIPPHPPHPRGSGAPACGRA